MAKGKTSTNVLLTLSLPDLDVSGPSDDIQQLLRTDYR